MEDHGREAAHKAALAMLDTFASVGAETFDLTLTTLQGEKIRFRRAVPLNKLRRALPQHLTGAATLQYNIIVRPHGPGVEFIQLDDLQKDALQHGQAVSFLSLETSPGNFQAWIALPAGTADEDFARRLRKGTGADPTASGATRIAGSLNFKDKYAPHFPRVQIAHSSPGLIVTKDQLAALKLVASPEIAPAKPFRVSPTRPGPGVRKWPSYARCLQGAPPNHGGTGPDVSRADFAWCMTAIDWGWSIEATAARLMEESTKAQANGEKYAQLTAQNAAAAVERRSQNQR